MLSDEDIKPKKKPVPITESQPPAPVVTEPPKTSASANRSKTMKELFGLDPGDNLYDFFKREISLSEILLT